MIDSRKYTVIFYCPDTHIISDGHTPYTVGIGGGVSARIRIARALSRMGHEIIMVTNCAQYEVIDGVKYVPLRSCKNIQGDVLVASTSGGELDLRHVLDIDLDVSQRLVWVHGTTKPKGLDAIGFDYLYCVSNFIAEIARSDWCVPKNRIFVVYNSFEEDVFTRAEKSNPIRDPYRLVYFSHPTKGLESALEVLRILRECNSKYHLMVYGGHALWGENESVCPSIDGVSYEGLVGQEKLAVELLKCTFSIHLQAREEPGALAILDAQRAGCVIIGSPVGCYPEMVEHGKSGYLIPGDHRSIDVRERAASIIIDLSRKDRELPILMANAKSVIWNSDTMARVWVGHWEYLRAIDTGVKKVASEKIDEPCTICKGELLRLQDGEHCVTCGRYFHHRDYRLHES